MTESPRQDAPAEPTEIEIGFGVSGWVRQRLRVYPDTDPTELIAMLADGRACTTTCDDGVVERTADGEPLADILGTRAEEEYLDFVIVPEMPLPGVRLGQSPSTEALS